MGEARRRMSWPIENTGHGSYQEIVAYVTAVLEQCTTVDGDTAHEKLARAIVSSVLSRLRDTSALTVRADELFAEYRRGLDDSVMRCDVTSLQEAVDECLSRLTAAVAELRREPDHA